MADQVVEKLLNFQLYNQINEVIGGSNDNQRFVMMTPGLVLNPKDYQWKENQQTNDEDLGPTETRKPTLIADRESRLAEMMFDPAPVVLGPNGTQLSRQYMATLRLLFPKVDENIENRRAEVRDIVFAKTERTIDDNEKFKGSLINYYAVLRDKCIAAHESFAKAKSEKWAEAVEAAQKAADERDSRGNRRADWDSNATEIYNRWYETAAPDYIERIKITNDIARANLAPEEYGLIMAIFNTSQGADRLKDLLDRVEINGLETQEGGITMPVNMIPSNWANLIKPTTNSIDLLKSSDHLKQKILLVKSKQKNAERVLNIIRSEVPSDSEIANSIKNLNDAREKQDEAHDAFKKTCTENTAFAVKLYLKAQTGGLSSVFKAKSGEEKNTVPELKDEDGVKEDGNGKLLPITFSDVEEISDGMNKLGKAQREYMKATAAVTQADLAKQSIQSKTVMKSAAEAMEALSDSTEELKELNAQLELALVAEKSRADGVINSSPQVNYDKHTLTELQAELKDKKDKDEYTTQSKNVSDNETKKEIIISILKKRDKEQAGYEEPVKDGYWTTFTKTFISDSSKQSEIAAAQSSQSQWEIDAFFASASGTNSSSSSSFFASQKSTSTSIEVSASVMRVQIDRPWMDTGIFTQLKSFLRLSEKKISHGTFKNPSDSLFSCFPTAFILAKDVSITMRVSEANATQSRQHAEKHSDAGGGFMCFSASSSSDKSSSSSSSVAQSHGDSLTIKIPDPQIIGWMLQAVPEDNAEILPRLNSGNGVLNSLLNAIKSKDYIDNESDATTE